VCVCTTAHCASGQKVKNMSTHMLILDVAVVAGEAQARQPLLKVYACDNPFAVHTLRHTIILL